MRRWLLVVACGLAVSAHAGPKAKGATKAKAPVAEFDAWAQPTMTKEQLLQFLPREMESLYKNMEPAKARQLQADLAELERTVVDPVDRVAVATLTAGFLEGLDFHEVAQVYNDWAVLQQPDSLVAIANVGALNCYPPILKLAIELDPKNPVPQVNLGSCAMAIQRWELAKPAYEAALLLKPDHKPALIGLGQWWLHVPDLEQAMRYFVKANGVVFQKVVDELKTPDGKVPPPANPIEPTDNRFGGGPATAAGEGEVGSALVTKNKLELPPLPHWSGPDAFIAAAPGRKKLGAFYSERMAGGLKMGMDMLKDNPLKKLQAERKRLEALSPEERDAELVDLALRPKWDDSGPSRALALNYAWAEEQLKKPNDDFEKATQAYKKIGEQLGEVAEARNQKLRALCPDGMGEAQLVACVKGAQTAMLDSCKQSMTLNAKFFTTYRDAYERWYADAKPVLEKLYRVQGEWIRQISDPLVWKAAVMARNTIVFSPLAMRMVEEDMMRLAFAGVGAASFGRSAEVCPQQPPEPPGKDEPPEVPDLGPPEQKCPLPKNGLKIPPFDIPGVKVPFSATVWCKEAEVKFSTGLSGGGAGSASGVLSVRHRLGTDKSTTVYLGVEAGLKKAGPGGTEVGVKGELGVSVTFRGGQVTDVGGKAGVSESFSLPGGVAKGSLGATAAIERGAPQVSFKASGSTKIPSL